MNILKLQKLIKENLITKNINDVLNNIVQEEKIENILINQIDLLENYNEQIYDIEFEICMFDTVNLSNIKLDNNTFRDVKFVNCNFANTSFSNTTFIRCEFTNCKLTGCNFSESRLYNVAILDSNANYINLSMASIERVLFQNTLLRNSYFQETKAKDIYFESSDLTQAQFFKTSLKNVDLSTSKIEGIAISVEDIKGAIIDEFQAPYLLYLLGVKIK